MTPYENELKIKAGDKITVEHPREGSVEITVDTAANWTYSRTPTARSDWYIEGRAWHGAVYWKQGCDGGHIVSLNGEKVIPGE